MHGAPSKATQPTVTIRVSGKLFQGHLAYLEQLIQTATDCRLWALLDVAELVEVDHAAVQFLMDGEGRDFGIVSCPSFVRECMDHERKRKAA